ncbi:MAG: EstA family serine hydrolase [Thermomicrobiales bacterium]|nr:EstA family serine hydrolase [Thermomicrobiales bacterium]
MVATIATGPSLAGADIDAPALAAVERGFREQLNPLRLFPGAVLAVYHRERLALDLGSGYADTQSGELVGAETLFPLFSGTKPFGAVALWQLIERGRLGFDEPVATYWPNFGQQGKHDVLIRHILSHRGGFPTTPAALPREQWGNWEAAIAAVAAMPLEHEPGTVSAYHFLTQHWVCGELIRRLDGRDYANYLREEITDPLGLHDTYFALPADFEQRLVKLHATDGTDEWGRDALRTMHDSPLHRTVIPGASGVSTARDMARFYAAIAAGGTIDGARILRPETVDRMLAIEVDGDTDATFDVPVRRGLGFELGGVADPRRHWPGSTSTSRTFWHGGFGSSICWGDADTGLTMAFLTNGVRRDEAGAVARRDLSDAVRAIGC